MYGPSTILASRRFQLGGGFIHGAFITAQLHVLFDEGGGFGGGGCFSAREISL
jgi:hypothetical protein